MFNSLGLRAAAPTPLPAGLGPAGSLLRAVGGSRPLVAASVLSGSMQGLGRARACGGGVGGTQWPRALADRIQTRKRPQTAVTW